MYPMENTINNNVTFIMLSIVGVSFTCVPSLILTNLCLIYIEFLEIFQHWLSINSK